MLTSKQELRDEYINFIQGKNIDEYLTTVRLGSKIKLKRKERKELYSSIQKMRFAPGWDKFFDDLDEQTYGKECPKCQGRGYLDAYYYHQSGICFKCQGKGRIK